MSILVKHLAELGRNRRGNVAIVTAVCLPLMIGALALGVDWGYLGYQKRDAQADTDLAAISAASDLAAPEASIGHYVASNDMRAEVMSEQNFATTPPAGDVVTYALGHYTPSASIARGERFTAGEAPYNAVRVRYRKRADLAFAHLFHSAPEIETQAIAGSDGMAALSIGSRLASLKGGILNDVLGGLLGTQIDLDVMDYRALLDTDVDVLSFLDTAATHLHLQAASYKSVLNSQVSIGQFLEILADTRGLTGTVRQVLEKTAEAGQRSDRSLMLGRLFNIGKLASLAPGEPATLSAKAGVLGLLSAAGAVASGTHQIDLGVGADVPGLASLGVSLLVGEPPQSAWYAVGDAGTVVRTAQTRLKIDALIVGQGLLSAVAIHLPIYIELAYAEGRITEINCTGAGPDEAEVEVAASPGVAQAWIGSLPDSDPMRLSGESPSSAKLVELKLLHVEIDGYAHTAASDPQPQTLSFSPNDIRNARAQTVSTHSLAGALVSSLVGDLDLKVNALGLNLVSPSALQHTLAGTLSTVARPLDGVVDNVLLALGIRLGEADIRVSGAACSRPVLVQ